VVFHRIYESVELGNASFDHQPPSKLVAPMRQAPIVLSEAQDRQMILPVEVVGAVD
jgi:hypothetical protein